MSPIEISEIQFDGNVLVLKDNLSMSVDFDQESQEFVLNYSEMGIVIGAESREDLITEFCEDFYWIWQEYAKDDASTLSQGARKLSQKIKEMVKEEIPNI
jgi:hypothetical protein